MRRRASRGGGNRWSLPFPGRKGPARAPKPYAMACGARALGMSDRELLGRQRALPLGCREPSRRPRALPAGARSSDQRQRSLLRGSRRKRRVPARPAPRSVRTSAWRSFSRSPSVPGSRESRACTRAPRARRRPSRAERTGCLRRARHRVGADLRERRRGPRGAAPTRLHLAPRSSDPRSSMRTTPSRSGARSDRLDASRARRG